MKSIIKRTYSTISYEKLKKPKRSIKNYKRLIRNLDALRPYDHQTLKQSQVKMLLGLSSSQAIKEGMVYKEGWLKILPGSKVKIILPEDIK